MAQRDSLAFTGLRWREIGPYRGGRSVAGTGNPSRPDEFWMGTTGGGVFKSINAGQSWAPVTDKYFGGTIGAIAVAPSAPDVVFVGGGEYPIRGNVSHGDGVWKTTDGGKTWTFMGLGDTRQIADIVVHPTNPDLVYVGALGHVWAPNAERGVFRSKDGGKTWEKILFRNDSTGVVDLVMDPNNPNVLYAGMWQAGRTPWLLSSGGSGQRNVQDDRRRRSLDGDHAESGAARGHLGQHRHHGVGRELESGLGEHRGRFGRRFPLRRRRQDVDAHEQPTAISGSARWYYTKIHADPKDTNVVYDNNVSFMKSTDGGKTFRAVRGIPHGDSHDLWIDPKNSNRMIESDDGGVDGEHRRRQDVVRRRFRDRAVLSRRRDDALAVSHLRRAAGQLHALRPEPGCVRHL